MFKQETDYKGYFLLAIILGGPAWIIYNSIEKAYPGMLDAVIGCMIITAGVALWAHWQANEPDAQVRRPALMMVVALAVCGALNVWLHVSLGRDVSTAEDAEATYQKDVTFENQIAAQEAERQVKLAEARALEAKANAQQANAEANRLRAIPASRRAQYVPLRRQSADPAPAESPTPVPGATIKQIERPKITAADVRAGRRGWAIALIVIEMLIAIGGGAWVQARKTWDVNENGIPDWIERVYARHPEYVQRRWPDIYEFLTTPATASASPGKG